MAKRPTTTLTKSIPRRCRIAEGKPLDSGDGVHADRGDQDAEKPRDQSFEERFAGQADDHRQPQEHQEKYSGGRSQATEASGGPGA